MNYSHGKRLVKVHMTNIAAASGRVRETNLSIQVCSVEVYLAAVFMDDIARLLDAVLKHTEGRRVCDLGNKMKPGTGIVLGNEAYHESREVVFVLLCLCTQVHNIEATVRQTLHRDHLQAGHDCGLGAFQHQKVSASKNSLTAGFVPCALTGMRQMFL
jgi:hypothetical protein